MRITDIVCKTENCVRCWFLIVYIILRKKTGTGSYYNRHVTTYTKTFKSPHGTVHVTFEIDLVDAEYQLKYTLQVQEGEFLAVCEYIGHEGTLAIMMRELVCSETFFFWGGKKKKKKH